jgi:type IV secretion system protein TrbL
MTPTRRPINSESPTMQASLRYAPWGARSMPGRRRRLLCASAGTTLLLLAICAHAALAAPSDSGTLTDVANAFKSTSGGWIATALGYARDLFLALVAIELAWTGITYLLQRDNLSDFVAQLVLKLMGIFFFFALLQNAPTWIPAIVDSFSQAGATIGGQGTVLDPSATFGLGLDLAKQMLATLDNPSLITAVFPALLAVFCSIGVVVAFAVVAGQLMVTLIESYIVISAGLFFLGFSGSRWTLPFSERYVGYAVSVGIKLFMLYLIVGLGATLAQTWQTLFTPGAVAAPQVYIGVAGSALVFMLLGWQIPALAGSLMNGSPAMTLGTAANVIGTTVAAGAGVAGGVLGAAGLGGAAAVAAATAVATRVVNPERLEGQTGSPRPVAIIGPPPRDSSPERASTAVFGESVTSAAAPPPTMTAGAGLGSTQSPDAALESTPPDAGVADQFPTREGAATDAASSVRQPLEDVAAQLAAGSSRRVAAPSSAWRSALDALLGVRIPTLPHDAASGSIQIRFRHHDGD